MNASLMDRFIIEAFKKMENDKAIGLDDIPIEVWKYLSEDSVLWLSKLFNRHLRSKKMSDDRRKSTPIYKN